MKKKSKIPMLQLFLNELTAQVSILEKHIDRLQVGSNIDEFLHVLKTIMAAARLVNQDNIYSLAHALSDYARAVSKKNIEINEEDRKTLQEVLQALERSTKVSGDEMDQQLQELNATFDALATQLYLRLSKHEENVPLTSSKMDKAVSKVIDGEGTTLEDSSMMELFTIELETQTYILNQGLITFEQSMDNIENLEPLMRAAHSIKGAARVVHLHAIVQLAHKMEDCFVEAQNKNIVFNEFNIDILLRGVDIFSKLAKASHNEVYDWMKKETNSIKMIATLIEEILEGKSAEEVSKKLDIMEVAAGTPKVSVKALANKAESQDRILRVTAQNINRLMGLAGESLVESRWLHPFSESLISLKKKQNELSLLLEQLQIELTEVDLSERTEHYLAELQHKNNEWRQNYSERLSQLEMFIIRNSNLSDRLYREVVNSRMRPFADGIEGFPRMVRDIARQLGKKVRLEVVGKSTPVDREILEKLEAPLSHLLRNALDHGIETPEERESLGKSPEGVIILQAEHRAGMLAISVTDDGCGIHIENLRNKIVEKGLAEKESAKNLSPSALFEFLFMPGFSTAEEVTEISGRGVGLDVVQNMVQEVAGSLRVLPEPNGGTRFDLQLPLTLSVIRSLLVTIGGEPYAFPLARIQRALLVAQENVELIENRQYFNFEGQNIGLISASQILQVEGASIGQELIPVVVLSDRNHSYGVVVDSLLEERELVVQELDPRLGKISNISAGAFMEDGSPVLIIDVVDMVNSIDILLSGGRLFQVNPEQEVEEVKKRKKILVVDDSITVREVECRLLRSKGYEIETAINGMDGWNAVRIGDYDLVITDIDMPRMNGIELVRAIKSDPNLQKLPVMIVSYKEREGDRQMGLEAGASYYLTKSSFHDDTLLNAVHDLIGDPILDKITH